MDNVRLMQWQLACLYENKPKGWRKLAKEIQAKLDAHYATVSYEDGYDKL